MMDIQTRQWGQNVLFAVTCIVIIIAGMKAAAGILVPFLLAVFISAISAPALFWLRERRHVPTWAAFSIVFLAILAVTGLLGLLIGTSVQDFSSKLPDYTERVRDDLTAIIASIEERVGRPIDNELIMEQLAPDAGFRVFGIVITGFGAILGNAFLVLLIVFFILLEAATFPPKLTAMKAGDTKLLDQAREMGLAIREYILMKSIISIATGTLIALGLVIIGVDYPILWGTVAFLFNFVPNIGSIIAAIPATLLALFQLGVLPTIYTAALYLAVNMLLGNFIEPRYVGRGLGLSPLVVFLSLVLWGWVLGPVGMLLSVPLTMALKIVLARNPETRWIAIVLGDEREAHAMGAPKVKPREPLTQPAGTASESGAEVK